MSKKPKATENKAKDVETKREIEKLWAQLGRLASDKEQHTLILQQIGQRMRNAVQQIRELEQKKNGRDR